MAPKRVLRLIRADDFVANSLEDRVNKLQDLGRANEAKQLRETAKSYRESGRPGVLSYWENAKEAEGFIHPDDVTVQR